MSKHNAKIIEQDWTCGDGCCYHNWYELHIDDVPVLNDHLKDSTAGVRNAYDSVESALIRALRVLGVEVEIIHSIYEQEDTDDAV